MQRQPSTVEDILKEFSSRRFAVLVDDAVKPPRGVFVRPATGITPTEVNELIGFCGGLVFVAVGAARAGAFMLTPMHPGAPGDRPVAGSGSDACVSVEAREGVTTGISAADRACTIGILGESTPNPRKLVRPGHIFPIVAAEGGALAKHALPEGALDLVKLSGFSDAAVFCDTLSPEGQLRTLDELAELATDRQAPLLMLSALVRYRLETEPLVSRVAEAKLPTEHAGMLRSCAYRSDVYSGEHLALVKGEIDPAAPILVRVQRESTCADVFGGDHHRSREQIVQSLKEIGSRGAGVLVYLRSSQRGQLKDQVEAGRDRPPQPEMLREYGIGAQILRDLGVRKIELLTSSKKNLVGLRTFGIEIVSQRPLVGQSR